MPASVIANFTNAFIGGFFKTMKEKIIDGGLLAFTLLYWLLSGKLSAHLWESVSPWVWVLSGIVAWHSVKAALDVIRRTTPAITESRILAASGEPVRFLVPAESFVKTKAILLALLLVGAMAGLSYLAYDKGHEAAQPSSIATTQESERAVLFGSINDFISKKDELELRETFDIPTVTRDAILEAKIQLTRGATQGEIDMVTRDMVDGKNVFYFRYIHTDGDNITPLPGKSGILHLTPKAVQARKQLAIFYSSALTPLDVSNALKDLEKAISDNQEILMDTINESYTSNPSTISNAFSCPKQDCMTVNNLFYSRFVQLQPKAEVITAAMRKYMGSR